MTAEQLHATIRNALAPFAQRLAALEASARGGGGGAFGSFDPWREVAQYKGRPHFFSFVGTQDFTSSQDGLRGAAINFQVSQDGPFVMTHYPVVMWKVSLPTGATNFGQWRPIYTWPLPAQQSAAAGTLEDIIDLSYEIQDAGSQRNFQNAAAPPLFSRPDALHPLPTPTLFRENSTISFIPTYETIDFATGGTATTGGRLVVMLPGLKIATGLAGNF